MDVENGVINYQRKIVSVTIATVPDERNSIFEMCELTVVGQAFLWHQIRCIVSVLIAVGQHKEDPRVVANLLDIETCPSKPQYSIASEVPLILFEAQFENQVEWQYPDSASGDLMKHLQGLWLQQETKSLMLRRAIEVYQAEASQSLGTASSVALAESLVPGNKPKVYQPLLMRAKCQSLEKRIESVKRRKLETNIDQYKTGN